MSMGRPLALFMGESQGTSSFQFSLRCPLIQEYGRVLGDPLKVLPGARAHPIGAALSYGRDTDPAKHAPKAQCMVRPTKVRSKKL